MILIVSVYLQERKQNKLTRWQRFILYKYNNLCRIIFLMEPEI